MPASSLINPHLFFFRSFRPITHAWEGGAALSKTDVFLNKMCVTKAEYEDNGKNICREKFDS